MENPVLPALSRWIAAVPGTGLCGNWQPRDRGVPDQLHCTAYQTSLVRIALLCNHDPQGCGAADCASIHDSNITVSSVNKPSLAERYHN